MNNANPSQPILEMRDVTAVSLRNSETVVAENVNWSVNTGDFWVIGGLHGSGKTDFLLMTGGLIAPKSGSYRLFGEEMPIFDDARLPQRLRLGLVFDGGQLFNHLTVAENVALPPRYHRKDQPEEILKQLHAILEAAELLQWADSTPGAISRNWQKRVGLARALTLRPEVLLVDNPLGGLDLRHANWWRGFLDQLSAGHPLMNGRPVTLIVTADDLRPWRERAHRFAFLREKKFIPLGGREELGGVADPLVKELLSGATLGV